VRAMQRTQFRAKSAKNGLKPTDFLNRKFYFETEGVQIKYRYLIEKSGHIRLTQGRDTLS
jgi:hypothetical protein